MAFFPGRESEEKDVYIKCAAREVGGSIRVSASQRSASVHVSGISRGGGKRKSVVKGVIQQKLARYSFATVRARALTPIQGCTAKIGCWESGNGKAMEHWGGGLYGKHPGEKRKQRRDHPGSIFMSLTSWAGNLLAEHACIRTGASWGGITACAWSLLWTVEFSKNGGIDGWERHEWKPQSPPPKRSSTGLPDVGKIPEGHKNGQNIENGPTVLIIFSCESSGSEKGAK